MRSCGWGGGPSMGNHCHSIRASVLDGLPIRRDSFYRVRLFLPVSFPKTSCRLTVAVVPCAAPRIQPLPLLWPVTLGSPERVPVFLLLHAIKSMVVYRSVQPLSCPPPCPLPQWGESRLRGAQSQVPGCVFGSRGASCKWDFFCLGFAFWDCGSSWLDDFIFPCRFSDCHQWLIYDAISDKFASVFFGVSCLAFSTVVKIVMDFSFVWPNIGYYTSASSRLSPFQLTKIQNMRIPGSLKKASCQQHAIFNACIHCL